jgi:hypothetical protein
VSADHLAGFAAECALKAILIGFFGIGLSAQGIPVEKSGARQIEYRHLPKLWGELAAVASGRAGAKFLAFVSGQNPFRAWDISDRYRDGSSITAQRAWSHVSAAGQILRLYQEAKLSGVVP